MGKDGNKVISVKGLTKRFGSFTAVDHITFDVTEGEIFGFLGANGAGKTTAMRMLCGLSFPTEGKGSVAGFDVMTQSEQIKRHIGYMSQRFSLYEDLTVSENLHFFAGIYGMKSDMAKKRINELLEQLRFTKERDTIVGSLPLGWKQKLSFAVATVHRPKVVFLDEAHGRSRPHHTQSVLGTHLFFRERGNNRIRYHALHGRSRILQPTFGDGGRTDKSTGYPQSPQMPL